MKLFFSSKRENPPPTAPAGSSTPLEAVPIIPREVAVRADRQGNLQLKRELKPDSGLARLLAPKFRLRNHIRLNLDAMGSFFWSRIDGRRNLGAIEENIRRAFHLEAKASRKATLEFTRRLMVKGLLQLKIPRPKTPGSTKSRPK